MKFEITDQERSLLSELVEEQQKRIIQELDHTDSRDYRELLRERLRTVESILGKVQIQAA